VPAPELELPDPVGMFGQWWPEVDAVEPVDEELPLPLDDVVVDELAVVVACVPVGGLAELAPAANMPIPRLNPAALATTAAATIGCLSRISLFLSLSLPGCVGSLPHIDSESPRDKRPQCNDYEDAKNSPGSRTRSVTVPGRDGRRGCRGC